jgi:ElaB/YqjD/DUF883 family membrane-anchored ribosome-binding protein
MGVCVRSEARRRADRSEVAFQVRGNAILICSDALNDANTLLREAAAETGERASDLRSQDAAKLLSAKLKLQDLQDDSVDSAKAAARVADDFVRDNPWQAMGAAAVSSLVVARPWKVAVDSHVAESKLTLLLPDWSSAPEPIFIVLPSRRDTPAKVRAFVDFAHALFSK